MKPYIQICVLALLIACARPAPDASASYIHSAPTATATAADWEYPSCGPIEHPKHHRKHHHHRHHAVPVNPAARLML